MLMALLSAAAIVQQPLGRDLLPQGKDAPGCALDVRRDGQVAEVAVTGAANLETPAANTADTVFEIGSVSKQFIGAGLAILAQRGRLRLDDPITKWLPELPPLYRGVTVAMLGHHTSGIRSWNALAELTGRNADATGYDNAWVLAAVAKQRALNNAPGVEYLYSNSNFVLGAIIIERAARQPLNTFFREALFARLGMSRTEWRTDFRKVVPGRAQAYGPVDDKSWQLDMPLNGVAGAGGLLSTVGDLQRWNAVLADPAPSDRAWVADVVRPGRLGDGTELRYGLGIQTDPIASLPALSHAGATGSYRAWLGYVPGARLSVALLCNSGAVNTEELGEAIATRYLPPVAASPAAAASKAYRPAGIAGVYRNVANDAAVQVTEDAAGLRLNGGPAFLGAGDGRLETIDRARSITLARERSGKVAGMTVSRVANSPTHLVRETLWTPTPAELALLSGTYVSLEIDGAQVIAVEDGGLIWRDPSGIPVKLVPIYRNGFEAPDTGWTLRFRVGPDRRPVLDLSIMRARRIAFTKLGGGRRP